MFDILSNVMNLEGTHALDLYAGTGSVGFEAISRGAAKVIFVESDHRIAEVIRANAIALEVESKCEIFVTKVERYMKMFFETTLKDENRFDIVFVDAPYKINDTTQRIIDYILMKGIVKDSGMICVEHSKGYSPSKAILFRQRTFGSTILSFIKPEKK
jgi:16S rRNA (guanine966-N2)-methyltransferase